MPTTKEGYVYNYYHYVGIFNVACYFSNELRCARHQKSCNILSALCIFCYLNLDLKLNINLGTKTTTPTNLPAFN